MKQNDTKNSRLLFLAVDPCKRIDTNEHKENSYLQLNYCGSLEVINTQRKKSVQICNCGILSRTQTQIVDCGRLSTQRHKFVADHWRWSTRRKAERTRVWINAKWNFFWGKLNTKNGCTQKMIADLSVDRHNWIEWTRKMKLLLLNFNARKRLI